MGKKTDTRDAFAAIVGALRSITDEQWLLMTACTSCGAVVGEHCRVRGRKGHAARVDRANRGINRRGHFAACLAEIDSGYSLAETFRFLRRDRVYKAALAAGYLEKL